MIAWDSGLLYDPAQLDAYYDFKRIFVYDGAGDYDLLTDDALARAFPNRFRVKTVNGYSSAAISAAVASKDTYVKLWISTPSVPTHFVLAVSAGGLQIADPWTGTIGVLAGYGGQAAVHKMIFVTKLPAPVVVPVKPIPVIVPEPKPVVIVPVPGPQAPSSPVGQDVLPDPPVVLPLPTPAPLPSVGKSSMILLQSVLFQIVAALTGKR